MKKIFVIVSSVGSGRSVGGGVGAAVTGCPVGGGVGAAVTGCPVSGDVGAAVSTGDGKFVGVDVSGGDVTEESWLGSRDGEGDEGLVGNNVSCSDEVNVGEADSFLGGIVGDDVSGKDVAEEASDGNIVNVNGGVVGLVVGTPVDVVLTVDTDTLAGKVKVCTRSPQSSSPFGDSNIFVPRRYPE